MLSDLDRSYKPDLPHACPIAYCFTGYSFTAQQGANILRCVRKSCNEKGLNIVAQCFDGAFAKLALRGEHNEPLTLLQLAKNTWSEACGLSKPEIVKQISLKEKIDGIETFQQLSQAFPIEYKLVEKENGMYFTGPIKISFSGDVYRTPNNWKELLTSKHTVNGNSDSVENTGLADDVITVLLQTSDENENTMTTEDESGVFAALNGITQKDLSPDDGIDRETTEAVNETPATRTKNKLDSYDIHTMWLSFCEIEKFKKSTKDEFVRIINTAETLSKLTKLEIMHMLKPVKGKLKECGMQSVANMKKANIINKFCGLFGDGSTVATKTSVYQPKTLRSISKGFIQTKLPKHFLNAAQASYIYPAKLQEWREQALFKDTCKVSNSQDPPFWYCQPKHLPIDSQYILEFLDPEHLLTNMRTKVCSSGMPKAGISKEAWLEVARNGKDNGSNLNLALVENLVDKQNVGFALKTFSSEVETAMRMKGYVKEAEFCKLIRNWYQAQDEGGMPSDQRHKYEQELRAWLLQDVKLDIFPPAGNHVKDIPIVLFEGLLLHIDRRSQLYAFTGGTYNARSIGTLDNENLFGAFQDWDSKGTGVLRTDEVPQALYTACDLYSTRLNSNRGFHMHTTAAQVYHVPSVIQTDNALSRLDHGMPSKEQLNNLDSIIRRDHIFDYTERINDHPKRKRGTISDINEPPKGNKGVRAERYTINESKILPHVRAGIDLTNT